MENQTNDTDILTENDSFKIIEYFSLLNEVDTDGIEPLTHFDGVTADAMSREDEVLDSSPREDMLKNTDHTDGIYISVPKTTIS